MATTAELLLDEVEKAGQELLQYGKHDGNCTNEHQMKIAPKVAPCSKHLSALKTREERFKRALDNLKLLRGVFGVSGEANIA